MFHFKDRYVDCMLYRRLLALLILPALGFGQIKAQRIGFVRYADASVRAIYGLPASFVVGQPMASAVKAASFSDQGGILSAAGQLQVVTDSGSIAAQTAGGDAVVGIDGALSTALAYLA